MRDNSYNAKSMFDAVNNIVNKLLKKVKYNYIDTGVVVRVNSDNTYEVKIRNGVTTVKSLHNIIYKESDVVYILILNNDFSKKIILDKV